MPAPPRALPSPCNRSRSGAQAVAAWERHLAPLAALARPEAPPPDSWDRIETRLNPHRATATRRSARVPWLWRGWAWGASLAAAGLAAFILVPRPLPPRIMTVLLTDENGLGFLADVDRRGELRLAAVPAATGRAVQAPSGKSLQLWCLPPRRHGARQSRRSAGRAGQGHHHPHHRRPAGCRHADRSQPGTGRWLPHRQTHRPCDLLSGAWPRRNGGVERDGPGSCVERPATL